MIFNVLQLKVKRQVQLFFRKRACLRLSLVMPRAFAITVSGTRRTSKGSGNSEISCNRPHLRYQYSNMAPRLSGLNCKISFVPKAYQGCLWKTGYYKAKNPFSKPGKRLADCELESHETIDWKSVYLLPFKCTKITELITFQFTLLQRRPATNSFLKKIGVKVSDLCIFCKTETERLIHLFWSCGVTSIFWQEFKQWITTNYDNVTSNFSLATVLGFKPFFISKKT